jgi:pimeloyl-ACP methyl ester carboxylesterase
MTVQSQGARRKYGFFFWTRRVLLVLVVALVVLGGTGAIYQAVATAFDQRAYPPPGQLVDVGGYSLHINCMGQGSPTVILEGGLAEASPFWGWVQPGAATTTRVCAYDRAGLGWSAPSPKPRDASTMAEELHTLLQRAKVAGPYVLVGHSFGGKYVRLFAAQYPSDIAGVVLVDSSHPDQFARTPAGTQQYDTTAHIATVFPLLARLGILRAIGYPAIDPALPEQQQAMLKTQLWTAQLADTFRDEYLVTPTTDAQVRATGDLGALPLVVLTATDHGYPPASAAEMEEYWRGLQAELVHLSSNSVQRIVAGATHPSIVTDRQHAQVTIAAIQQVVEAARTGQPLHP